MSRLNAPATSPPTIEERLGVPAVRTYRQIARILTEREGAAINQALVGRMCRAAEMKLAGLLLADPVIRERLAPSAAQALHGKANSAPFRLAKALN
jgi:hypothetical protein